MGWSCSTNLARRAPYFPRGTGVHRRDGEANDEVRPYGERVGREKSRADDRDVCHSVVARRREGRACEATAMSPEAGQHERTSEIDGKRASAGERQR